MDVCGRVVALYERVVGFWDMSMGQAAGGAGHHKHVKSGVDVVAEGFLLGAVGQHSRGQQSEGSWTRRVSGIESIVLCTRPSGR